MWLLCWRRVLRRSAGWRRTAERTPDPNPAMKWKSGRGFVSFDLFFYTMLCVMMYMYKMYLGEGQIYIYIRYILDIWDMTYKKRISFQHFLHLTFRFSKIIMAFRSLN